MKLSQVVARIALAASLLVAGTTAATADGPAAAGAAETSSQGSEAASSAEAGKASDEAAAGAAASSSDSTKKNPWRGSIVSYEHAFSAVSLDKASGQTWNPYYAHSFSIQPQWHFHDYVGLKLRIDVEQELTNSDDTVKRYEWMWSDLNIDVNAGKGYTEKVTGIKINGGLRLGIPASKASQARTMILSLAPMLNVSRKFPVLQGLTIGYSVRFAWQFHQSTTAQYDGTSLSCGDPDSEACERFLNTGIRNAKNVLVHGPSISLDILDNLSLSFSYTMRRMGLYDLKDEDIYDSGTGAYLGTLASGENDITARYGQSFAGEISWNPIDLVGLSLGFSTVYGDLRQNGSKQTPLFNQFTNIYLNISLDIDEITQMFR